MGSAADAAGSLATNAASASFGTNLLNGALGGLAGIAANLVIDLIVTGITDLINAQENAIKKADEALANLEERRESLQNNRTTINEISGDYERLADGVDKFGRNISLSADEYDRYNQIANQIAEMFPQMVQGYTAEGNAIIAHKGNVEALTRAYEEQQRAAREASVASAGDVFSGYKAAIGDDVWRGSGDYTKSKQIESIVNNKNDSEKLKDALRAYGGSFDVIDLLNEIGYNAGAKQTVDAGLYSKLIEEDPDKIVSYYRSLVSKVNVETAKIKPIAFDYVNLMADNMGYTAEAKEALQSIVTQLGPEFYTSFDNSDQLFASLSDGLIEKFQGEEGQQLTNKFSEIFQLKDAFEANELDTESYLKKLGEFKQVFEELPEEMRKPLQDAFDLGENGVEIDEMFQTVRQTLNKRSRWKVGSLSQEELQIAYQVVDKYDSWSELERKIAVAKRSAMSLQEVYDDLAKPLERVSKSQDIFSQALAEQESQGVVTADTLNELIQLNGDYAQCLEDTGGKLTLNSEKFQELNKEQLKSAKAATDAELAGTLWQAALNGSNEALDNQISKLTLLSGQYEYATSNLKAWRDAQSGPDKGDLFDEGKSAYETLVEDYEAGNTGTNRFKAAKELLLGEKATGDMEADIKTLKEFFEDEDKTIESGWKKLKDSGLASGEGLESVLGKNVDIAKIAEAMGYTDEMAQMWVDMAEKKGYVFDFSDTGILEAEKTVLKLGSAFRNLDEARRKGIDVDGAEDEVNNLIDQLSQMPDEILQTVGLRVEVKDEGDTEQKILKTLDGGVTIDANISAEELQKTLAVVNSDPENENSVKIPFIIEDEAAKKEIESFQDLLDNLPSSKGIRLYVYGEEPTGAAAMSSKAQNKYWNGKYQKIYGGTAQASGTGISGVPETGNVLVGEEAPEMYVNRRTGRWQLVGMLGAEFIHAEKGDIIFNARQTRSLLNNGFAASRGKAFAKGTNEFLNFSGGRYVSHTDWSKWSRTGSRSLGGTVTLKPKVENKDIYLADIDELYEAETRLKALEQDEEALNHALKMTDSLSEQVNLTRQLNENYRQQQAELHAANERRDELIKANVEKLRGAGFNVYYDPEQNRLMVANMEHINELMGGSQEGTNALRKEYEELISETEKLNEANQKSSAEWLKHAEAIRKNNLEMVEKNLQGYKEFISYADDFDLWDKMDTTKLDVLKNQLEYVNQAFRQGLISAEEFKKKTREIGKEIYKEQKSALKEIIELTEDLIKQETKDRVDALNDQIDKYQEIIDLKKKALQDEADEKDYSKERDQKLKEISKLQSQISRLSLDDSREAAYERMQLEEELAEKQQELADFQEDHAREAQIDALDEEAERFKKAKDKEIEETEAKIDTEEKLYQEAMKRIEAEGENLQDTLIKYVIKFKDAIDGESSVVSALKIAQKAVQEFGNSWEAALKGANLEFAGGESGKNISELTAQMRHNSNLWQGADKDERARLEQANEDLAAKIQEALGDNGTVFKKDGTWYFTDKSGRKMLLYDIYHEGGIVGSGMSVRDDEVFALLQKGELVLDRDAKKTVYEVVDFVKEMQDRFGADISTASKQFSPLLPRLENQYTKAARELAPMGDAVFSPTINVEFHHQGGMKDSDAVKYGNMIANTALDSLQNMFVKTGVSTHRFAGFKQ